VVNVSKLEKTRDSMHAGFCGALLVGGVCHECTAQREPNIYRFTDALRLAKTLCLRVLALQNDKTMPMKNTTIAG